MRIVQALAIKVALPLGVTGVMLLSGAAAVVPTITATVNSAPVASAVTAGPNMHYE
jgi:hypothetical protein